MYSNYYAAIIIDFVQFIEEFILLKLSPKGHLFTMGNQSDEVIVISHLDTCDIQVLVIMRVCIFVITRFISCLKCPLQMNSQVLADSYAILLDSLDGVDDDDGIKVTPNVTRSQNSNLVFQISLPYRRLWNYTVLAHGCEQHPVTSNTILSKNCYVCKRTCVMCLFFRYS